MSQHRLSYAGAGAAGTASLPTHQNGWATPNRFGPLLDGRDGRPSIPPERLLRCGEHTLHFVRLPGRHSGLGRARHFPNISLVGQSHALDNAAGPAVQAQDNVARLEVLGDQRPVIRERDSGGDQSARDNDCDCLLIHVSPSQSRRPRERRPPDHDPGQQVIPADFRIRDWPCRIHSASELFWFTQRLALVCTISITFRPRRLWCRSRRAP